MKVKTVAIGLQSLEEGLRDFVAAAEATRQGKSVARSDSVNFTSLEAMRRVLTPKRLHLLRLIKEQEPGSIYELAGLAKRDLTNVRDDVALLARIGLVTLSRGASRRRRVVPRVGYDQISVQIPLG